MQFSFLEGRDLCRIFPLGMALDPGVIQAALMQVADATKAAVLAAQSAGWSRMQRNVETIAKCRLVEAVEQGQCVGQQNS